MLKHTAMCDTHTLLSEKEVTKRNFLIQERWCECLTLNKRGGKL